MMIDLFACWSGGEKILRVGDGTQKYFALELGMHC